MATSLSGSQFNVLNKGSERECGSALKKIREALFCNLKILFRFSLRVDPQMFAP